MSASRRNSAFPLDFVFTVVPRLHYNSETRIQFLDELSRFINEFIVREFEQDSYTDIKQAIRGECGKTIHESANLLWNRLFNALQTDASYGGLNAYAHAILAATHVRTSVNDTKTLLEIWEMYKICEMNTQMGAVPTVANDGAAVPAVANDVATVPTGVATDAVHTVANDDAAVPTVANDDAAVPTVANDDATVPTGVAADAVSTGAADDAAAVPTVVSDADNAAMPTMAGDSAAVPTGDAFSRVSLYVLIIQVICLGMVRLFLAGIVFLLNCIVGDVPPTSGIEGVVNDVSTGLKTCLRMLMMILESCKDMFIMILVSIWFLLLKLCISDVAANAANSSSETLATTSSSIPLMRRQTMIDKCDVETDISQEIAPQFDIWTLMQQNVPIRVGHVVVAFCAFTSYAFMVAVLLNQH